MAPSPLDIVRKVYYRIDGGSWSAASGSGPWSATYFGLSVGSHTIDAFGTNGLESPSINTDKASVPIIGNIASYSFNNATTPPPPDLAASQSASPDPASTGKDVIVSVTATNNGPGDKSGISLADTIPAGVDFIWASPGCSDSSGTVTCTVGTLAEGTSRSFDIVIRPSTAGTATNTVSVSPQADATPGNDTSAHDITVNASPAATQVLRYRLYYPPTMEHLYTTDLNEYNTLASRGWQQEGSTGYVLDNPGSFNGVNAVPYYRLYTPGRNWHHWTTDPNEYYTLMHDPAWVGEGVDGYIIPTSTAGTIALHRLLYPDGRGMHHWTTDANEYATLTSPTWGWVDEGIAGYLIQ